MCHHLGASQLLDILLLHLHCCYLFPLESHSNEPAVCFLQTAVLSDTELRALPILGFDNNCEAVVNIILALNNSFIIFPTLLLDKTIKHWVKRKHEVTVGIKKTTAHVQATVGHNPTQKSHQTCPLCLLFFFSVRDTIQIYNALLPHSHVMQPTKKKIHRSLSSFFLWFELREMVKGFKQLFSNDNVTTVFLRFLVV